MPGLGRAAQQFLIDYPSADANTELTTNISGRQANRGMEGLAISPDGTRLFGIMQSPLIQDGALDSSSPPNRIGTNNRIVEINLVTGAPAATDIRGVPRLPTTGTPAAVVPVAKTLFLDLLDPAFGLVGASFPEKIEGLAVGPDLPDGRHLLIVTNDNDFVPTQPNRFLAFAIDAFDLPNFTRQNISLFNRSFDDEVDG